MHLSIVIPAYNEEQAIAATVERCLAAREILIRDVPLDEVEIIVVSDGSTDGTERIVRGFLPRVRLISYPHNRGYGMALKLGFELARGDIVGFLDADGTCDPLDFAPLVRELANRDADICLGSRLAPGTHMPPIRQLGNRLYAFIVGLMGAGRVTDTASGMRVIRKSSLERIYPLPDGLNFTPAMTCRALLDDSLTIVETPISYDKRVGKSKLSLLRDGLAFLSTIIDISLTYRAFRILGFPGLLMMLVSFGYGLPLLVRYARVQMVSDGMIYRIAFIVAVGVGGLTLFNIGLLASRLSQLVHTSARTRPSPLAPLTHLMNQKAMSALAVLCIVGAVLINRNAIYQYATMRRVLVHWSAVMTGAFLLLMGIQFFAFAVLDRVQHLLHGRMAHTDLSTEAQHLEVKD